MIGLSIILRMIRRTNLLPYLLLPSAFSLRKPIEMRLCVLHNLYFYNKMMEEIRDAIEHHRYAEYKAEKLARMAEGEKN